MDCTLATLIACFSWSNFYVDAGLAYQDAGYYVERIDHEAVRVERDGEVISNGEYTLKSTRGVRETPYGRISLGWSMQFSPQLTADFAVSHISSVKNPDDRGVNGVSLSVRWHPWR